jgi:hypothetical protein
MASTNAEELLLNMSGLMELALDFVQSAELLIKKLPPLQTSQTGTTTAHPRIKLQLRTLKSF